MQETAKLKRPCVTPPLELDGDDDVVVGPRSEEKKKRIERGRGGLLCSIAFLGIHADVTRPCLALAGARLSLLFFFFFTSLLFCFLI
jgi:hypothetical protein